MTALHPQRPTPPEVDWPVTEVVAALTAAARSVEQLTKQGSAPFRILVCPSSLMRGTDSAERRPFARGGRDEWAVVEVTCRGSPSPLCPDLGARSMRDAERRRRR